MQSQNSSKAATTTLEWIDNKQYASCVTYPYPHNDHLNSSDVQSQAYPMAEVGWTGDKSPVATPYPSKIAHENVLNRQ